MGIDFDAPKQNLLGWWRIRRLVLGCRVSTKWVSRHQRMGCVVFHGEGSGTIETSLTKQRRRIVEATDDDSNEDRERLSFWQKHTERVQLRVQTHNRGMVLGLEVNVTMFCRLHSMENGVKEVREHSFGWESRSNWGSG